MRGKAFVWLAALGLAAGMTAARAEVAGADSPGEGAGGRKAQGRHEPSGEMREFHKQQAEARRAHFEKQREENRAFHKTLEGVAPKDACLKIIEHRNMQYSQNREFLAGQHNARMEFLRKIMQEKGVPAEEQAARLEKINARREEMEQKAATRHEDMIRLLTDLSNKEDLTWEELRKAMREEFPRREGGRRRGEGGVPPAGGNEGQITM